MRPGRPAAETDALIIQAITVAGGCIRSENGWGVTATIARDAGCSEYVVANRLRLLDAAGRIVRSLRGKRCYWIAIPGHVPALGSVPDAPSPVKITHVQPTAESPPKAPSEPAVKQPEPPGRVSVRPDAVAAILRQAAEGIEIAAEFHQLQDRYAEIVDRQAALRELVIRRTAERDRAEQERDAALVDVAAHRAEVMRLCGMVSVSA